jgi:hypothetical protein
MLDADEEARMTSTLVGNAAQNRQLYWDIDVKGFF